MQQTWVQSLGWEDPLGRKWQGSPVSLPGDSMGREAWQCFSSQGHKRVGQWLRDWTSAIQTLIHIPSQNNRHRTDTGRRALAGRVLMGAACVLVLCDGRFLIPGGPAGSDGPGGLWFQETDPSPLPAHPLSSFHSQVGSVSALQLSARWVDYGLSKELAKSLWGICTSLSFIMLSCSDVSDSLQPHGLYLARFLYPWSWFDVKMFDWQLIFK